MNKLDVTAASETHITFDIGGQQATLSAADVSRLIETLAKYRMTMNPPVPESIALNQVIAWTRDPLVAQNTEFKDGVQVFVRHGGHGWLGFVFSEDGARAMQTILAGGTAH